MNITIFRCIKKIYLATYLVTKSELFILYINLYIYWAENTNLFYINKTNSYNNEILFLHI
jgi:hypothetical protein